MKRNELEKLIGMKTRVGRTRIFNGRRSSPARFIEVAYPDGEQEFKYPYKGVGRNIEEACDDFVRAHYIRIYGTDWIAS